MPVRDPNASRAAMTAATSSAVSTFQSSS